MVTLNSFSENRFVETTLRYVLSYMGTLPDANPHPSTSITILADNDYYSQPLSPTPRFNNLAVTLSDSHKTGLGSSAALVTALTTCLLTSFSPPPTSAPAMRTIEKQQLIHNLSQASHCAAQGKVGSGFDVAAAVFGSCVYRRFSPSILEEVPDPSYGAFARLLKEVVEGPWDLQVSKTRVPKGIRVVMGDVDCGSSTPGMVKTLLKWRSENVEDAKLVWDGLEALNKGLIDMLEELRLCAEEDAGIYEEALETVRKQGWKEGGGSKSLQILQKIGCQIAKIRKVIRAMGEAAGVPIEPVEQTKLLDAVEGQIKGVLGGVVPGAGGYDAVAFLLVDHEETLGELNAVLAGWEGGAGGKVKMLETREEQEGVRREELEGYEGWGFV